MYRVGCLFGSVTVGFSEPRPLLDNLLRGMTLTQDEKDRLIPLLSLFCSLMINTLLAVHDDEFFKEDSDRPLSTLFLSISV